LVLVGQDKKLLFPFERFQVTDVEKLQEGAEDVDVDVVIDANLSGLSLCHAAIEHCGKDWAPDAEDEAVGSKGLIPNEELDVGELFSDSGAPDLFSPSRVHKVKVIVCDLVEHFYVKDDAGWRILSFILCFLEITHLKTFSFYWHPIVIQVLIIYGGSHLVYYAATLLMTVTYQS